MFQTDQFETNLNFNTSIEDSILETVRNQQAQFELLTREQEEERQLITNKLHEYNKLKQIKNKQLKIKNSIINNDDLSDIISIPSITATSNDDLLSNDENLNKKINETIQANNLKMLETNSIDPKTTDHYSYSYTYTTQDDPNRPGVSSVEVNESVTEEVGPDGTKIIRRHQQEKQINKVTQVVTQRVIKRQYIDPLTGKTIEYNPNDERFANLPPETVFEEHTIRSNETPPPASLQLNTFKTSTNNNSSSLLRQINNLQLDSGDYSDGNTLNGTLNKRTLRPEDNQGYPEEKNMDYDPDDVNYPEDPQYEGLVPDNQHHTSSSALNLDANIYTPSSISPAETLNRQSHISKQTNGSHSQLASSTLRSNFNNINGHSSPLLTTTINNSNNDYGMIPHYSINNGNNSQYIDPIYESRYSAIKQHEIDSLMRNMHLNSNNNNNNYSSVDYGTYQDHMNIYGSFNPHNNQFNRNIMGRQTFLSQQQQQSPIYRTRSPSIDSRIREQSGWRNPDLEEVIEYLTHPSNEIKANAAAYLQHLCYQDDETKAKTRQLDGIPRLINLLKSDLIEVYKNACGALRNLSYGRNNDENKLEIRNKNGIKALIDLLKRCNDESTRETATAVLWNLSSCEEIKQNIINDGLDVLVQRIIIQYATFDTLTNYKLKASSNKGRLLTDASAYPTVLTNATGILRNCSSNLNFQSCYEARRKLRDYDELIRALLRIIDFAIRPHSDSKYRQLNIDSKCVENCMCILRNLSFRLQEIKDPNYDRDVPPIPINSSTSANNQLIDEKLSKKEKKKKLSEDEFMRNTYPYNMKVPQEGRAQELLWDLNTLQKYIVIIKESTMRDTIEAAVGCIQNLTACYWAPSVAIRSEVRKAKCLPTLVFLLQSDKIEDEPLVSVTSIALRNLAIDAKNRELIGKYAMKDLVRKLPDPQKPVRQLSILNEDTITAALACINECIKSSDEFVRSCYNEGGVTRMVFITRHSSQFPTKIVKYAAYVLTSMWKHKALHDLLKKDGYKENDFLAPAHSMGLKSINSSPVNTLHRPRGDIKSSNKQQKNLNNSINNLNNNSNTTTNGYNYRSSNKSLNSYNSSNGNGSLNNVHNSSQRNLIQNDTIDAPIYSQVQKNHNVIQDNPNDRILTVMKGAINADSWV